MRKILLALVMASLVTACFPGTRPLPSPAPPSGGGAPAPTTTASAPQRIEGAGNLGTNLWGVSYWDGVIAFADLMDQAGEWVPQIDGGAWGAGPPLALDAHGWPTALLPGQYASTVLVEGPHPAGEYRVRWKGAGRFEIGGRSFGGDASGGAGTITLDGTSTVVLHLRSTNPGDPLHDIEVRLPGEPDSAVFRSGYLQQRSIYRAVRFMDWQRTNATPGAPARSFTCATRIDDAHYSQGTALGVSAERMVDLANALHADPWFTIPHDATDDWVECHARVVAQRLLPGLTPRYEFSNETWNPTFGQYHDLADQAAARGLGGDEFEGVQLRSGELHAHVMQIVKSVFDTAGRPVIRVLAGQAANVWVAERRLSAPGALDATDEIAIAPYMMLREDLFDPAVGDAMSRRSPDEIVAMLGTALDQDAQGWMREHQALATRTSRPLVAYEGGQHLAGDQGNARLTDTLTAANRSQAMGDLYRRYLDTWASITPNGLFMHFSDSSAANEFGSWGAVESWVSTTSPKYDALVWFATSPRS